MRSLCSRALRKDTAVHPPSQGCPLGTPRPCLHLQSEPWVPKPGVQDPPWVCDGGPVALTCRWHAQDADRAGRWPTLPLFFFFYIPFSPPSHIAVSCSAGHLPTFRQQLHKKSFFSWNLGPLLMCDLQQ